ncbi:MAG TPA: hypothetical protein VFU43_30285 [Streptosporangiaceae bacterium]|nr:hypothetical protein [Streptosporangiaceae bacterium]
MRQPAGHAHPAPLRGRWLPAVAVAVLLAAVLSPVLLVTPAAAVADRDGGSPSGRQGISVVDQVAVVASRTQRPIPGRAGAQRAAPDIPTADGVGGHPAAVPASGASIRPPAVAVALSASRPGADAGVATIGGIGSRAPPRAPVDL